MNADSLLGLYDRVADAPDAVSRLRRFVLDLAVRGKLVEQDPADEPASELLRRIAVEKARMVQVGEIRRPRKLSNGEDLVPPFEIPATWRWCHLDVVGAIVGGGTPRTGDPRNFSKPGEGVAWLTPKDLGGHRSPYIERGSRDLSERGLRSSSATLMPPGTVLFSSRAPIGYVAIASNPISTNQGFKSVVPYVSGCSKYIALAMQAFAPEIEASAPGTTFKEASGKIVAGVPFPLPPLVEQRRIVAKVDELMAVCDRFEETRTAREDTRDRLSTASLAHLTPTDTDARTFRSHVRFAVEALPVLTARADQVEHLRQTILNLAVRGKLVDQDPADEPADELLKQIAAKKRLLLKVRKVRRPKPTESLPLAERVLGLPSGWVAARLSDVVMELQTGPFGSSLHRSDYEIGGTPVINPASIRHGKIVPVERMAIGDETLKRLATFKLRVGDIVMGRRGEMGRCAVVAEREDGWLCGTGSLILRLSDSIYPQYLAMLIGSPDVREYLQGSSVGATMRNLNQSILLAMSVGLPPLVEQRRIVAKVDDLMVLCDRMETGLGVADHTRSRLLESILHDVLGSAQPERATDGHSGHEVPGPRVYGAGTPRQGHLNRGASTSDPFTILTQA